MPDVYDMMMKLGLSGGALTDLVTVSERLTRIHRLSEDISSSFSRWHLALGGVGAALLGGGILGAMEKVLEKSKEYNDVLIKLRRTGPEFRAMVDSGEFDKMAYAMANRSKLKIEDVSNIPATAFSIMGKEEAVKLWEPLSRYAWLQQMSDKNFAGDPEKPLKALMRAGEMTGRFTDAEGHFDTKKAQEFLDLVSKIKAATHGMVNEQTILGFAQQAGPTARNLTNQGFMMEAIQMQAMGGQRAGTSLMSLWQQMAGGTMFKRTAEGMQEMGLLKPEEWKTSGGRVILTPEASKRLTKLIGKDPTDLATEILNSFAEKGITDPEERQRMLMRMLNRQTTQRMMSEMVVNRRQQRGEQERMAGSMGSDESLALMNEKSITANLQAVKNAWHNLEVAISGPNSESMIRVLQGLTSMINSMQESVRGVDPHTIETIGIGIASLGAALVGTGMVAILAAIGPAGWLIGGLTALAIAIEANKKWAESTSIADAFIAMSTSIANAFMSIPTIFNKGIDSLIEGLNSVATAIINWVTGLRASILSLLPNWLSTPFGSKSGQGGGAEGGWDEKPKPQSFNPSNNKQVLQPVTLTMNIDGRTMAQAVTDVLSDLYEHPTGSPSPDGLLKFRPQGNFSDT